MNCKETENNIWEYVEGSLDKSKSEQIAEHIESCAHCASLVKGVRSSLQMIGQTKKTEVDPFFYTRLEARMERESKRKLPPKTYAVRYAMATSIVFLAILGGNIFGSFSAEQLNTDFAKQQVNVEQMDDFGLELADNSFDLINDFK